MKMETKQGMSRLCLLLAVLWIIGMGWYQFQYQPKEQKESFRISLDDKTEISINSSGIQKADKQEVQMEKLAWVLLPALLLLLVVPVGGWVTGGFKPGTK